MYAYAPDEIAHLRTRLDWTRQRISPQFRLPNQVLGTKRTIGCVALEVTQRCNLDCSICYLSPNSESTPDIPLETIMHRIQLIRDRYGVGTNVQVTGGDPTLRNHDELVRIVRRLVELKLCPSLFTNGVHATRELLGRLKEVGLVDVAFHVDLTEKRKGFTTEAQLCAVREEYIERARGLGINVIFNQTVFAKNLDEVEMLVKFYAKNADVVGMASFQLQADTGRGLTRTRKQTINLDTVSERIDGALGAKLSWENVLFGHPKCHRIGYAGIIGEGDTVVDLFDDPVVLQDMLKTFDDIYMDRTRPARAVGQVLEAAVKRGWLGPGLKYWGKRVVENAGPILKARGKVRKLSFFMQNFQDRTRLDHDRVDNCSFHTMNDGGGISMCVHNAYRDFYLQGGTGYPEEYQQWRLKDGYHPTEAGQLQGGAPGGMVGEAK
jgi:pyruvate-formate lyase-activating enzyme